MRIQKLNAQTMTEVKQHEYALLNEIAQDSMVTQANLSIRPPGDRCWKCQLVYQAPDPSRLGKGISP